MSNIFLTLAIALSGASLFFFNVSLPPLALVGYQEYVAPQKIPRAEVIPQPLDRGIEQCENCKIVFYGSIWEILFKMPDEWETQEAESLFSGHMKHVISATGAQWYFLDKTSGDYELGHMELHGKSNELISFTFYRTLPEIYVYESVKDFDEAGFKGKIYQVSADQGGGKTLFFELPDKKYAVGIGGNHEYFDEFIKGIKLAK